MKKHPSTRTKLSTALNATISNAQAMQCYRDTFAYCLDITKETNITITSLDTFLEIQLVPFPTTVSHESIHQKECSDNTTELTN